ncbi:unnamed protein product [Eruca vesicaria subsp. sativa]|uniref:Sas10 C-terminal domain-containing protein n=1 Tax=Eruca vesicaria subsp. sativa TaxID=29727 RepID=A0ABC8LJL5_ERUVS|nr:unnamed protein product [Eruca vesicaria subsp. sativa]
MGKKGGFQKRVSKSTKTRNDFVDGDYDDEIDAFHKQRDIVPLDVNDDTDDSSDEDDVQPVFDLKGVDDDEDEDEEDEDSEDEEEEKGLIAKMVGQNKYLKAKFGVVDDEMADDDKDKDEEDKRVTWGSRKHVYRDADNVDFEYLSSDDENIKLEEDEVLRLRAEQTGSITAADAGLEDDSEEEESDRELTMEEISVKGKKSTKSTTDKRDKDVEVIKKDINSLSKEEQMDVVYSSAPEIVGLLSELNDAVEELENKINPIMIKLKEGAVPLTGGARYLEVKQILLLAYCQSITFYFLLKSEGQPIRDHPVLARLVDIKSLLDKIKELDGELPPGFEESLAKMQKVVKEDALSSPVSADKITQDTVEPVKISKSKAEKKGEKRKNQQNDQVDIQSEEMLKLRAALEGKLRSNGVFGSTVSKSDKPQKRQKLANRKLETFDDYVDDADNSTHAVPANKLVSTKRKPKTISGDDDLPQRDDIGERRRKFELKVLAGAGVKSEEDGKNESEVFASDEDNDKDEDGDDDMVDSDGESEGEDEFYKQVKQNKQAKRAAKAEIYSRELSSIPSEPDTVDGKRVVSNAILSNRGLTRHRNKDKKNPRKNYRDKYADKVKRRKGQVRDIRKPTGSYGGESSGINPNISRTIRFKN